MCASMLALHRFTVQQSKSTPTQMVFTSRQVVSVVCKATTHLVFSSKSTLARRLDPGLSSLAW